ncbi:hypothetical protein G6011_00368 [Alternaria panax]|uniref:Transcription factor domain-containing protein n=1 Tax=Alternaria panax TaxID=48097 RepID=A0AAD4NUY1_9PLEO|nr:hypothetical protein G6011_00368 [Alternaria panax]
MLQNLPEKDAADVFRRIRAGANAEAVVKHIQDGSLAMESSNVPQASSRFHFPFMDKIPTSLRESTYFQSLVYEAIEASDYDTNTSQTCSTHQKSNYSRALLTARLVDTLLEDAQPSHWTNVSSNDRLLRSILESYFINQYPRQFFFVKTYFLEDMALRRNEYCSPLLVNALLAKACVSSRLFANQNEFWNPDSLSYRFLAEAKRLWELEGGEPKLTTIQAGCLINATMNDFGHDEAGYSYILKTLNMAHKMSLFALQLDGNRFEHAKSFTAWALSSWLSLQSYYYFKPPCLLDVPAGPLPEVDDESEWYGNIVLHYPPDEYHYPSDFGYGMKALSELRVIQNEIGIMCFSRSKESKKMPWGAALHIQAKLEAWYKGLPPQLQPRWIVYPSHLVLHCEYYAVLITLFRSQISSEDDCTRLLTQSQRSAAQQVVTQAKVQLESILRIYYLRHSFEGYDSMLTIFLVHLANLILAPLQQLEQDPTSERSETSEALLSTLILCFNGLYEQSKSAYIAGVMLALMKKRLSADARNVVGRYVNIEERDNDADSIDETNLEYSHPILSELVLPGTSLSDDPKIWRVKHLMDDFRRKLV